MALTDFFRINLPYGMRRNADGEWFFFNREYVPLGWNDKYFRPGGDAGDAPFSDLPVYTKYKRLIEPTLLKLAWDPEHGVRRNDKGEIVAVWFYNDGMNPTNNPKYWDAYFEKLKRLSGHHVKEYA